MELDASRDTERREICDSVTRLIKGGITSQAAQKHANEVGWQVCEASTWLILGADHHEYLQVSEAHRAAHQAEHSFEQLGRARIECSHGDSLAKEVTVLHTYTDQKSLWVSTRQEKGIPLQLSHDQHKIGDAEQHWQTIWDRTILGSNRTWLRRPDTDLQYTDVVVLKGKTDEERQAIKYAELRTSTSMKNSAWATYLAESGKQRNSTSFLSNL